MLFRIVLVTKELAGIGTADHAAAANVQLSKKKCNVASKLVTYLVTRGILSCLGKYTTVGTVARMQEW